MLDFKVKIGLVPDVRDLFDFETRKGIFEPAKGVENKNKVLKYIKESFADDITEFCDLEWLNELGVVYKNSDCDKVCDYLREQKVDAIFIINCNFGNEEVCGQIAKKMGLPVLLWGPQDMVFEENGQRYTDAQCGLFAISKQLRRYKVPFSYIENCPVESDVFKDGFNKFLKVVTMIKNFKNLNVVQVGTRLTPFKSVMYNELELTEKFGINVNNYTLLGGNFKTVDGPVTFGTYMWAEFKDWAKVERKMIEGPYIHHMSEIYGDYSEVLKEFCKFIPELTFDPVE